MTTEQGVKLTNRDRHYLATGLLYLDPRGLTPSDRQILRDLAEDLEEYVLEDADESYIKRVKEKVILLQRQIVGNGNDLISAEDKLILILLSNVPKGGMDKIYYVPKGPKLDF